MTALVSVVIPSFGNHDGLGAVLDGLADQDSGPVHEVIVVVDRDDPDPEAATEVIATRSLPVRQLQGPRAGASANRNAGWRAASAPLVLFIDNDTVPTPSLAREHLEWHRRTPDEMLAVLGHVRWARSVRVSPFMRWLDQGIQFDYPSIRGIDAGWGRFYSANISVTRTMLERLGGFDEERFPYGYEDVDLAYRAREHGLRVFYNRDAVVEHLREYDLEFFRRRVGRIAASEREFVRAHPEVPPFYFNLFSHAASQRPGSGRGRHLTRWLPRATPLLGERAWSSADLYFAQALAPEFLSAWESAGSGPK
jgi:GT2 family glycosyltransferase